MSIYNLYGFQNVSLEQAKYFIETVLHIKFEEHDSLYQGGEYYKYGKTGGENFILKQNVDPFDDYDLIEPNFAEYNVLFYINNTQRSFELLSMINILEQCHLLKSEDL